MKLQTIMDNMIKKAKENKNNLIYFELGTGLFCQLAVETGEDKTNGTIERYKSGSYRTLCKNDKKDMGIMARYCISHHDRAYCDESGAH